MRAMGAVLVNVNPAYRPYDLSFVLRKSKMKALFLWEKDKRSDYRAIVEEAMREVGTVAGLGARYLLRYGWLGADAGAWARYPRAGDIRWRSD